MNSCLLDLYPDITLDIKYSRKFTNYNANVRMVGKKLFYRLSHEWKEVTPEITKGLLQHLAGKMFNDTVETMYVDLYNEFIKKLTDFSPITDVDPFLKERFAVVNEKYFANTMELPNLIFGKASKRTLGTYHFQTDTVRLSTLLMNDIEALDFVLYHELLHKQQKYVVKNGRTHAHTRKFRELEKQFENFDAVEKRLQHLTRRRLFFS